jgi:ParB family chromosome partitioning protein
MRLSIRTEHCDLHLLDLCFRDLRVADNKAIDRLATSIGRSGQLTPVVAVAQQADRRVVIDGYRRIEALQQLGKDTCVVELWECEVSQALLLTLARVQSRRWEAIEEACVIRELIDQFGCSQREVAQQTGRDVSWVSRRLALLTGLSDEVLTSVQGGELSTWAASRIVAPLARANSKHAQQLLEAHRKEPLSTRDLSRWYQHYQQANRSQREKMAANPNLFLQALSAGEQKQQDDRLGSGPEGAWLQDLATVRRMLRRLVRQVPTLFATAQDKAEQARLSHALDQAKAAFNALDETVRRHHAANQNTTSHPRPERKRTLHPKDQHNPEGIAQGDPAGTEKTGADPAFKKAADHIAAARAVLDIQGKRGADPGSAEQRT